MYVCMYGTFTRAVNDFYIYQEFSRQVKEKNGKIRLNKIMKKECNFTMIILIKALNYLVFAEEVDA